MEDVECDCVQRGVRKHSFWDDPVGSMLSYLCEPRPCVNKVNAIAHNAKAFDLLFILNRAIVLKWRSEQITKGLKIMCMKMDQLVFLKSVSFLPCSLRKLPEAFGLTASKAWYPHYFNTEENVVYIGPIPMSRSTALMRSANRRGKIFSPGTKYKKRKVLCSIKDACWKRTAKIMSRS